MLSRLTRALAGGGALLVRTARGTSARGAAALITPPIPKTLAENFKISLSIVLQRGEAQDGATILTDKETICYGKRDIRL